MNDVRSVLRAWLRQTPTGHATNVNIDVALRSASDRQVEDLGAEAAAVYLTSLGAEKVMLAVEGGTARCEHSGRILVAVIDAKLIVFGVRTRFRSARAGHLTSAGNLARPALGSGAADSLTDRLRRTIVVGDGYDGVYRRMVVVDLKSMLIQQFSISPDGRALAPLGRPSVCRSAAARALDIIAAHPH